MEKKTLSLIGFLAILALVASGCSEPNSALAFSPTPSQIRPLPTSALKVDIGECPNKGIASESNNVPEPQWAPIKGPLAVQQEFERVSCELWAELRSASPDIDRVVQLQQQYKEIQSRLTRTNGDEFLPSREELATYIRLDVQYRELPQADPLTFNASYEDCNPDIGCNPSIVALYKDYRIEAVNYLWVQRFHIDPSGRVPNDQIAFVAIGRQCTFVLNEENYLQGHTCPMYGLLWAKNDKEGMYLVQNFNAFGFITMDWVQN
jgi:hypothetical protein